MRAVKDARESHSGLCDVYGVDQVIRSSRLEQLDNRKQIDKICTPEDKNKAEAFLRRLWRECFGDPEAYEDFYFTRIYRKNIVYAIKDKGMLHLNPYLCKVGKRNRELYYIVGVGTRLSQRRKGIMRQLLKQALREMYGNGIPFTYLMPANVRYYEPFGFVSISKKRQIVLSEENDRHNGLVGSAYIENSGEKEILYMKYEQMLDRLDMEERQRIYERIDNILEKKYHIFPKHDTSYFELLAEEKGCQNGNVVFCFEGNCLADNLLGFFAYSMEETDVYVEQNVYWSEIPAEKIYAVISAYISAGNQITVIEQFPFMVRVVNVLECIKQFPESFYPYAVERKRIFVMDEDVNGNNGIYSFFLKGDRVCVKKQATSYPAEVTEEEENGWDYKVSVQELGKWIFKEQFKGRIFFAEVV